MADKKSEAGKPVECPSILGATFAERAAARNKGAKQVDPESTEDKSVKSAATKSRTKKP